MSNFPNWFRKYALRGITFISTFLGLFWTVGFIAPLFVDECPPAVLGVVILAFTGSLSWIIFSIFPNFLKQIDNISSMRLIVMLLAYSFLSYLALIPICGLYGYFLGLHGPDPNASDGVIAIALMAVWLPLWWAPAFGAVWTWIKGSKHK